jgi:hypothetical protein
MAPMEKAFQIYEELAEREALRGGTAQRDRFLVLAADAAWTADQPAETERLRQRLLHGNPHHLFKPYHSWAEALQSPDIRSYLGDLRKNCPVEKAEQLLREKPAAEPAAAAAAAEPEPEEPAVLRLQSPPEKPAPPRPAPPPPAKPTATLPRPAPVRPPTLPAPFVAAPVSPAAGTEDDEPEQARADVWIATGLFVLILAIAVALAGYTLVWPFLGG